MPSFQFDPTTGLLDTSQFPKDPASETAARQQFMTLFNQLKDYLNNDNDAVKLGGVEAADYPRKSVDFVNSIAANGYYKLPSGLIIQWVTVVSASIPAGNYGLTAINFPIAFPNACFTVNATGSPSSAWANNLSVIGDVQSPSQATVYAFNGHSSAQTFTLRVIAIGH